MTGNGKDSAATYVCPTTTACTYCSIDCSGEYGCDKSELGSNSCDNVYVTSSSIDDYSLSGMNYITYIQLQFMYKNK